MVSLTILRRCFFTVPLSMNSGLLECWDSLLQQLPPDKKSLPMQLLPDKIAATCETGGSVRAKAHNKKSLPKQTFIRSTHTFKTEHTNFSFLNPNSTYALGQTLDRLVTVSSMPYGTSTSALSTLSSLRGLTSFEWEFSS